MIDLRTLDDILTRHLSRSFLTTLDYIPKSRPYESRLEESFISIQIISMSGRRAASNRIRGPQSALTDFLAANNISAAQIHADYERRQRSAQVESEQVQGPENATEAAVHEASGSDVQENQRKRKRHQGLALAKIKQKKKLQSGKHKASKRAADFQDDDPDEGSEYDFGMDMYNKKTPLPGQLENCDECGVRFTVTPYSKTGADGGLLCRKCSKKQDVDRKHEEKLKKQSRPREKRRQVQSNLLDGIVQIGPRSLLDHCLKIIGNNIHDIDELGDLPQNLLTQSAQLLSKKRLLTPRTLNLFIDPNAESITLYDCGKLDACDFVKIFSSMPRLCKIDLRFAGQFNNEVLGYLLQHNVPVEDLRLDGANLVSNDQWEHLFDHCGPSLHSLKLSWLDNAFDDDTLAHLIESCPKLKRLKLRKCMHLSEHALHMLSNLKQLEHLTLQMDKTLSPDALCFMIRQIGPQLRTLSLENLVDANNDVLAVIRASCSRLRKLRLTGNDQCTDQGFRKLFLDSANPPLSFADLSSNRDVNYEAPDGPDDAVGLASAGFEALMEHSGPGLESLDIHSCRHISHRSLAHVFDGGTVYPMLIKIDVSFIPAIDTAILAGIIKSCPRLKKLTAFACFHAGGVTIPQGLAVVGIPDKAMYQGTDEILIV